MFENVDGRTPDAGVIGILMAHRGAFYLKAPTKTHLKMSSAANYCLIFLTNLSIKQHYVSNTLQETI